MSWLPDVTSSHRLQLGITALVSGCIAASAVVGLQEARKWYNERELKDSIPDLNQPHDVEQVWCTYESCDTWPLVDNVRD